MTEEPRPVAGWPRLVLRLTGGGLLIATGAIHLDLYLTGYRTISVIGPLFGLQVIAAFALGLAVLAIGSRRPRASWLAATAVSHLPPWAVTCCRCGSACSGSGRSAPPPGSWPG